MLKLQDMDDPKIIDGKRLAQQYEEALKKEVAKLPKRPKIVSILIGDNPSSILYTKIKEKKAAEVGIDFEAICLPAQTSFAEVVKEILRFNKTVDGLLVQLPLPKEFLKGHQEEDLLKMIATQKDVDGLTGKSLLPATVQAILTILKEEKIPVEGQKVVVIGKSREVGKPVAEELQKLGGKVEICDSKTNNLKEETLQADILISAAGVAGLVQGEMVKNGVVIIDVGAEKVKGRLSGDVDFASVYPKALKITPVPGGVGPMTVISLMENVVKLVNGNF